MHSADTPGPGMFDPADPDTAKVIEMADRTRAVVHRSGPIRPFAVCHSFGAGERHTRDPAEVTCRECLRLMGGEEDREAR